MGMFDVLITKNNVNCSKCNNPLDLLEGIQTKLFDSTLEYFVSGDILFETTDDKPMVCIEHEKCNHCNNYENIYIATKFGIYIELFSSNDEALEAINNFDLLKSYKNQVKTKNGFKDKFNWLTFSISELETYYESVKNKHSQFIRLSRLDDILDYDIFKSLRNLVNKSRD